MGSMVQGLCLDTQNTPSSQTLYNGQEFVFYINWVIMHSIAKQGQALLSGMHAMGLYNRSQSEHASSGSMLVAL